MSVYTGFEQKTVVLADDNSLTTDDFPQLLQITGLEGAIDETLGADAEAARAIVSSPEFSSRDMVDALDGGGEVRTLDEIEAEVIRLALGHYQGQMSEVARRLGIGRSTLYRKVRQHGIEVEAAVAATGAET